MDTRRGYVIQVTLEEGGFRFLYSSDIEGANLDAQIEFIVSHDPDLILLDGPAISFPKSRSQRIGEIINKTRVKTIIVDHHLMRETNWRDFIKDDLEAALRKGAHLVSAAQYRGEKENLLEARRVELYKEFPI
jgi:predicted metallo-beta-lactamase superfamily hydrolase